MKRKLICCMPMILSFLLVGIVTVTVGQEGATMKRPEREPITPTPEQKEALILKRLKNAQDKSLDGKYKGVSIRAEIVDALSESGDPRAVPVLIKLLDDSYADVRSSAAGGLGHYFSDDKRAIAPLVRTLKHRSPMVRLSAVEALVQMGQGKNRKIFPTLAKLAKKMPRKQFRWEDTGTSRDWIRSDSEGEEISETIMKGWRLRAFTIALAMKDNLSKSQIETLIANIQDLTTDSAPHVSRGATAVIKRLREKK